MRVTLISSIVLLLLFNGAQSQEECVAKCAEKFDAEKGLSACKNGCRLAMVFNFAVAGDSQAVNEKCRDGCAKSYVGDADSLDDCAFGCDSQPLVSKGSMEVSISNSDPTFNVVRGAMNDIFSKFSNSMPSFESSESSSESDNEMADPFAAMRLHMQKEMARFQQVAQHFIDINRENVAVNRPQGHLLQAMQGPVVGNEDKDGSSIIEVIPVPYNDPRYGHPGVDPHADEVSWISRLAMRARRLSVLSQWLICVALVLCLILMLSISLAILKQIKAQKYHNLRSAHVVMPAGFGDPLPAKKVPLESPSAAMDYPLIHDSPPPAYDQLSIHKIKPDEKPQQ